MTWRMQYTHVDEEREAEQKRRATKEYALAQRKRGFYCDGTVYCRCLACRPSGGSIYD